MPRVVHNQLSVAKIRALKNPGRHVDGNGLYLRVDMTGNKAWFLRATIAHRRRELRLGYWPEVSLSDARQERDSVLHRVKMGENPFAEAAAKKEAVKQAATTLEEYTRTHFERIKNRISTEKDRKAWLSSMERYVFTKIGKRPLAEIDTDDMVKVLEPIWTKKAYTANDLKQRLSGVFRSAMAVKKHPGPNPTETVLDALGSNSHKKKHRPALPWKDVPSFYKRLGDLPMDDISRSGFRFMILTAARPGEVRNAEWSEINWEERLWEIPAEKMKMRRPHRVPLSQQALALLREVKKTSGRGNLIFPSPRGDKPYSDMVFTKAIERLDLKGRVTAHGFRSSFRDWAAETRKFERDAMERALAHEPKSAVEAAYFRTDLLDARRPMMVDWAAFVTKRQ